MLILVSMNPVRKILPFVILLAALNFLNFKASGQKAVNGFLDISNNSISEKGSVDLSGQWEFYWNQLLSPEDFKSGKQMSRTFAKVPGAWNIINNGHEITEFGYATYRLLIKTNPHDSVFGIRINRIDASYKLWVNGILIATLGKTGTSKEQSIPKWGTQEKIINSNLTEQEIIIQVSNFSYVRGGIPKMIQITSTESMKNQIKKEIGLDFLLLGIMLIIGLYHIVLFLFRKSLKSSLYFAILSFFAAGLVIVSSNFDIVYLFWPNISWPLQIKLEYSFYFLSILSLLLFVESLFEKESRSYSIRAAIIFSAFMSIFVVVSPVSVFISIFDFVGWIFILISLFLMFVVLKAILLRKEGSQSTFIGLSLLSLAIINDVIVNKYSIHGYFLLPVGFLGFMLIQAYIISSRFTDAISYTEQLTEEMDYMNNNLELIVKDRTSKIEQQKEELTVQSESLKVANEEIVKINQILERQGGEMNKKNRALTDSLNYAKRLQSAVLPDTNYLKEALPDHFIFFQPKDIVSGDFYWYGEVDSSWDFDDASHIQVLVAADCTGHGVPGAFMTLLGHNFLNVTVNIQQVTDPEQIIYKLDQQVVETLRQNDPASIKDGMDIAVLSIEKEKQQISFAGAGNPLYYFSKGEFHEIKGANFGIGGVLRKEKVFEPHKIQYDPGDVFYIFTDGFPDQIGGKEGRKFYKTRFRELLMEIHEKPMEEQRDLLQKQFYDWKGDFKQIDDILVIGIKMD